MGKAKTFKEYIRRTFSLYAIILVCLMFAVFLITVNYTYKKTIVQTNETYNEQLHRLLSDEFAEYDHALHMFANDEAIQKVISDSSYFVVANEQLYEFRNIRQIKSQFVILDKKLNIVTSNLYEPNKQRLQQSFFLQDVTNKLRTFDHVSGTLSITFENGQESNYYFASAITSEGEIIGYLLFFLNDFGNNATLQRVDIVAIVDSFDNVIFTTNELIKNSRGKISIEHIEESRATFNSNRYFLSENKLIGYDINILTLTSIENYEQSILFAFVFLFAFSVIVVLLIVLVTPKLVKRNLQSVDALLAAVQQVKQGNMNYRIKFTTFAEFQELFDEFNKMSSQVQQLIKRNDEIAENKRQMELRHLENQFNPHFVFNVLEMLRYEILFNPENASNIVVAFANLMRYNINYGNVKVPLKTDLKYIKDYLLLQKMRYNERLHYEIKVDETLLNFEIPKLLLQPIIENSVKHNMEHTRSLTIFISIQRNDNDIEIRVEDNGRGIDDHKLSHITESLQDTARMPEQIGLYHSHRILQLLYSENYGLSIMSKKGVGTTVILKIPITGETNDV